MVSLPLAGRVGRTDDDAAASSGVEAGVAVPHAPVFRVAAHPSRLFAEFIIGPAKPDLVALKRATLPAKGRERKRRVRRS
jgi:hypothetical protein